MTGKDATYKISLNGIDATKDLSPYVKTITYTDNMGDKSDEVEVVLDNSDGRFLNAWYITTSMTIDVEIGQMKCGRFSIDQSTQSAPNFEATIRGQSSLYLKYLKQKRSKSHHKTKLPSILETYAKEHGFTMHGSPPDIQIQTLIQSKKSDMAYLHELARTYGCVFALKGTNMIFDTIENIWKRDAAKTIYLTDKNSYSFTSSIERTADVGMTVYHDPVKEETTNTSTYTTAHDFGDRQVADITKGYGGNSLRNKFQIPKPDDSNTLYTTEWDKDYKSASNSVAVTYKKTDSAEEAQRMSLAKILYGIRQNFTGSARIPGDELIVAGQTIGIEGVGKRSGKYLVESSSHSLSKEGGYWTTITLSQIAQGGAKAPVVKKVDPPLNNGSANSPLDRGWQGHNKPGTEMP